MQLPATDELVLISGLAPIRARKLRNFAVADFTARVAPSPALAYGRYADRPKARSNDWGCLARLTDARSERAVAADAANEDGGMQQQRHPVIPDDPSVKPIEIDDAQLQLDDDVGDAEQRAMDQARGLNAVTRGYALNESSGRDLLPRL